VRGLCGRPCLVALLALAVPVNERAAADQVIASRDVGAHVAVADDGSAFVVSPSAGRDPGRRSVVRARRAAPGETFGPSRILMRSSRADRAVDAGVAADGSGVIIVQSLRRAHRRVRVVAFKPRGPIGRPMTLSARGGPADFAASATARGGAAVVVWFRHRGGGRWRLEAAIREPGSAAFGTPQPLSPFVRRPCCTSVSVGIGERGEVVATWSSTSRPGVWAALRGPGREFRRARQVAEASSDAPRVVVGSGGTAALLYSVQHVPRRMDDGLQLHRAGSGGAFGAAEQVDAQCRAASGEVAVTPTGRVLVACVDEHDEHVRLSEARPGEPLVATGELGTRVAPEGLAVAADDAGRAVVSWPERVPGQRAYREQALAAMRPALDAPFVAPVTLGHPRPAAEPALGRLVPGGGALVLWRASREGSRGQRRTALAITRLP
jgi:hypothetical protein